MENIGFIPFGTQYYRAPTPQPSEWNADLKKIALCGFNTIKIWAQWRWNNPQQGKYDFSDLDELMRLAEKYELKVIMNVILDVAPAWFFRAYPDSIMVMNNGEKLMPQTTAYRQIGGAPGPCYHHPQAQKYKNDFVLALAERYKGNKMLYAWDLWNEPELTCGIAREPDEKKMVCYCEHSRIAFLSWLTKKYGTIEKLNQVWHRNYFSFEETELPRNPRVFRDMIDWREFYADTLVYDLQSRINCIKRCDTLHPVMVHTVPSPYFNMINCCCDDYKMAKICDMFGNSIGSAPFPAKLSVCSAKKKTVLNAEIHAVGGDTINRPNIATYNDFKRHIFIPFATGVKGFLFWQYRPEIVGAESPAWGLTDLEGNPTDALEYAIRINGILQKNQAFFSVCRPPQSKIAIVKDNDNEVFIWSANGSLDKYHKSLFGAFDLFHDANLDVDIITTQQLVEEGISEYDLVYYPFPYYMKERIAQVIQAWIANGGTFLTESFFGGYKAEDGYHSTTIPGYGFDRIFGATEERATTASVFKAAYGEQWGIEDRESSMIRINVEGMDAPVDGYFFCESFRKSDGTIFATYENQKIAGVKNFYGKGTAILMGSLLGAGYAVTQNQANVQFVRKIAALSGITPLCTVDHPKIRCDLLSGGEEAVLVLVNNSAYAGSITITMEQDYSQAECLESGRSYALSENAFSVSIEKGDVRLFQLTN